MLKEGKWRMSSTDDSCNRTFYFSISNHPFAQWWWTSRDTCFQKSYNDFSRRTKIPCKNFTQCICVCMNNWLLKKNFFCNTTFRKEKTKQTSPFVLFSKLLKRTFLYYTISYNTERSPIWHNNALFASKAKINDFWNFFEWRIPEGDLEWRKNSKNIDFSLWGNRATTM